MQGLTENEAAERLKQYGKNAVHLNEGKRLLHIVAGVVKEPMFLLLVLACALYFLLGESAEGFMMVVALCFVGAISVYQEVRTSNALAALNDLTEPQATVVRDGVRKSIVVEMIVPGDLLLLSEGEKVPADAAVLHANDLTLNEAILTGEAFPVEKNAEEKIFQGTVINSGQCTATVTATGVHTALGKIGKSIITYNETQTELQLRVNKLVKRLALFGLSAFLLIFFVNFFHNHNFVSSLLFGLTLAMSAIPEEIPVAFSSFMALGAHSMSKLGIVTRQPQTVENLGAVNVICLDKTGTITANKMSVDAVCPFTGNESNFSAADLLYYTFLASEASPFDAMEKAIEEAFEKTGDSRKRHEMVKEFALEGRPPMMTHVYAEGNGFRAAAKGAVERILDVCALTAKQRESILHQAYSLASKGHRVLGVATALHTDEAFPQTQDEFHWQFTGLLSLYDPPKTFVKDVLQKFYKAGITAKLLTGDYAQTAHAIATEIGLRNGVPSLSGDEVMQSNDEELRKLVHTTNVFTRMYPEAKLKVVNALKAEGFIVAMTGDGVNDGPALKAADIGIALGKGGTEVARQSADLILTDDDLRKIGDAVEYGRKIFSNFKKAVRYIISIHIPIILIASLPLLLGWKYPNIYTPIHVIFLELIMGPTCSVFYEREPAEAAIMLQPPRRRNEGWFARDELFISISQGLIIALGILLLYYFYSATGASITEVRTVVFITLILCNIFLTYANRSFEQTILKTIRYKNNLALPTMVLSICFLLLLLFAPFAQGFFGMTNLPPLRFFVCLFTALLCVGWFELYKANLKSFSLPAFPDHKQALD
ncbi:cation-translocating P-type ATPase [Flavisolibacter ginsenosidimutans]|uniref:Cation-translocating P-type ATPase n=1 Tax=Flavisolibacter ginsenosidimutans TaxID=661481 RepID=A0A5B8UMW0_9BACT|nr:cation-translocating P-type ATPase [Flavisolibacter ginsenosidimutans]QEC57918.1 cation-translocating P-type ATPase [Flavisolibacter ginsenosidimutans]